MQPGVMHYKKEPFTTTQIVLKPNGLQTLLGINASLLTNSILSGQAQLCRPLVWQEQTGTLRKAGTYCSVRW